MNENLIKKALQEGTSMSELAEDFYNSEDNYNNCDKTSNQKVYNTLEDVREAIKQILIELTQDTHWLLLAEGWKIKAIPDDHRGREIVIYFKGDEEITLERIKSPEHYTANELISELEKEDC